MAPLPEFNHLLASFEALDVPMSIGCQLPGSVLLRGLIELHKEFNIVFGPMSDQLDLQALQLLHRLLSLEGQGLMPQMKELQDSAAGLAYSHLDTCSIRENVALIQGRQRGLTALLLILFVWKGGKRVQGTNLGSLTGQAKVIFSQRQFCFVLLDLF